MDNQPYQVQTFWVPELRKVKSALLTYAKAFNPVCYLDSNEYRQTLPQRYECLLGVGAEEFLRCPDAPGAFDQWQAFTGKKKDWQFGYLSYDLKNDVEDLTSEHTDSLDFPELYFFRPLQVFELLTDGRLRISSKTETPEQIFQQYLQPQLESSGSTTPLPAPGINMQARVQEQDYLAIIQKVREHILAGDIYEMNYCQEFYAENCNLDPWALFQTFNHTTQAPFAAFFRETDHFLISGSPERFLFKEGNKLTSQPIKGTIRRSANPIEDTQLERDLFHSEKDRAENVMIVDLVRNDLARSCQTGSVQVDELFGIYRFQQVFQMISTVSGQLKENISWVEALRYAFPMGSMTGAPKVKSMELIERYERSKRGLYSGAVGYITPEGNFDFNVVIRSLLYNRANQYLSLHVGGAIVYDSDPKAEYEECLLKAGAAFDLLGHTPVRSTLKPSRVISSQNAG
jgi:para-aminobenzoate synthetase component 1